MIALSKTIATVAVVLGLTLGFALSAHPSTIGTGTVLPASSSHRSLPVGIYTVTKRTIVSTEYINMAKPIGVCRIHTNGHVCTVYARTRVPSVVGKTLGSTGVVAGFIACTSPPLPAGQMWHAWPLGTLYRYQIQHILSFVPTTARGTLYKFVPQKNAIACG